MGEVGCLKDGSFQNLQVEGTIIYDTCRLNLNKWGIRYASGGIASAGGDTTEVITFNHATPINADSDFAVVGQQASNDTDTLDKSVITANTLTITASANPATDHAYNYAILRENCIPDYEIFAAGTVTTAGGDTAESVTLTGALASDIAFTNYSATDDTDTIAKAVMSANTLTVTLSADPTTTHGLHFVVIRPRGNFTPSHYVAYVGEHTTAGGDTTETVAVTGALATDIPIVSMSTSNDQDQVAAAVMTTDTLTLTMTADPSTAHKVTYMILRAV